jgi:transposase-like protein
MAEQDLLKWRHFQPEIILLCVHWCLRYSLSYRDLEEMMRERGLLPVDHTTIYRWGQQYAPELERRCRPHLKPTTDSWRVDEMSIKVKKEWVYLYRAVDSTLGIHSISSRISTRDGEAAPRFFLKTLTASHTSVPRVINVDKNAAYFKAFKELKVAGILPESCELTPASSILIIWWNKIIARIKRLMKPGMGFFSDLTAWRTLQGYAGDEYDQERTSARHSKRRCERAGCPDRQALWSSCLILQ